MTERTPEEIRALLRQLKRQQRDEKIRAGRMAPRTLRELPIWRAGLAERFGLDDQDHTADPSTEAPERAEAASWPRDTTEPPRARRRRHQAHGTVLGHRPPDDQPPDAA